MDIKPLLTNYALGLCSKPLKVAEKQPTEPPTEPTADYYLYAHKAHEDETPTHTIDGVEYVGVITPDIFTVYTPELQKDYPFAAILRWKGTGSEVLRLYISDRAISKYGTSGWYRQARLSADSTEWGAFGSQYGGPGTNVA